MPRTSQDLAAAAARKPTTRSGFSIGEQRHMDEFFKNSKPVGTLVEVNRMTRDGAKIEIEVTALVKKD